MQERLDQTCHLPIGTRDAIHVPFVVARLAESVSMEDRLAGLKPGSFVRFTDAEYTKFVICDKQLAHGILNPFVDEISYYEPVVVLLMPGITTPVRHRFDINPSLKESERQWLSARLEEAKEEDPDCAGCYEIRNNKIIRN